MTPSFSPSDQPDSPAPLRVRGPAALAAALPYLFSVPLQGRLVVTRVEAGHFARGASHAQLPDCPAGSSAEVRERWADDVGALIAEGVAAAQSADHLLAVVLYLPTGAPLDDQGLTERIRSSIPAGAVARTLDIVAVAGGRWRSILCRNEDCCPVEGKTILDDVDAVRVCAELIGKSLMSAPVPDPQAVAQVRAALGESAWPVTFQAREALLLRAWPLVVEPANELDPTDAAVLIMAADRPGVRDALLARLARVGDSTPMGWAVQEALWERVAAVAPYEWLAGPACMLAVARWALADGPGALVAVRQALAADRDHRMAGLVERLLSGGVGAQDWMARLAGLTEDDCLAFDRPPTGYRQDQRRAG